MRRAGGSPRSLLVLVLVGLVVAAAGAAGQTAAPVERREPAGTYRRPLGNEPASLDPARLVDVYGRSVAQQIFEGLVRFDQTLTIAPRSPSSGSPPATGSRGRSPCARG